MIPTKGEKLLFIMLLQTVLKKKLNKLIITKFFFLSSLSFLIGFFFSFSFLFLLLYNYLSWKAVFRTKEKGQWYMTTKIAQINLKLPTQKETLL